MFLGCNPPEVNATFLQLSKRVFLVVVHADLDLREGIFEFEPDSHLYGMQILQGT